LMTKSVSVAAAAGEKEEAVLVEGFIAAPEIVTPSTTPVILAAASTVATAVTSAAAAAAAATTTSTPTPTPTSAAPVTATLETPDPAEETVAAKVSDDSNSISTTDPESLLTSETNNIYFFVKQSNPILKGALKIDGGGGKIESSDSGIVPRHVKIADSLRQAFAKHAVFKGAATLCASGFLQDPSQEHEAGLEEAAKGAVNLGDGLGAVRPVVTASSGWLALDCSVSGVMGSDGAPKEPKTPPTELVVHSVFADGTLSEYDGRYVLQPRISTTVREVNLFYLRKLSIQKLI